MVRPRYLKTIESKLEIFGPYSLRLIIGLAVGIFSLAIFAKVSEDLLFNELQLFDQVVTKAVRFYTSPLLTKVMIWISNLGSPQVVTVIGLMTAGYFLLMRKYYWKAIQVPIVLTGATVLNLALKALFHRQRPDLIHLVKASGLSYPSGHAMISLSFYGLLIYLFLPEISKGVLRYFLISLVATLILLIGISRIYLGVHYPSDVLAGFAAGSAWLVACLLGFKGIRPAKQANLP